jgi:hypothetical protein
MTDPQNDSFEPYDPPGARTVRFSLNALFTLFWIIVTIAMLPLWLLIPIPTTVKGVCRCVFKWLIARMPRRVLGASGVLFKWAARAVEGRGGRLISGGAITTLYYRYVTRRYVQACICLVMATCTLLVVVALYKPSNSVTLLYLACLQFVLCALLSVRIRLLSYRINTGLFGTSPHEICDVIEFMVRKVDDIDFTGGFGKRLRAPLSEGPVSTEASEPHSQGVRA